MRDLLQLPREESGTIPVDAFLPDEPDFPEGASTWTRIRIAADWLAERMRRSGTASPAAPVPANRPAPGFQRAAYSPGSLQPQTTPTAPTRLATQHEAFTEHEKQPRYEGLKGPGTVVFVGGALGELGDAPVFKAFQSFVAAEQPAVYFSEAQGAELAEYLDANAGNVEAVYAHSYGADTAATQIAKGHGKGVSLYTIDPVSRFPPDFAAVKRNAGRWVNYLSTSNGAVADKIALLGGRWGNGPNAYATQIMSPHDHVSIATSFLRKTARESSWT